MFKNLARLLALALLSTVIPLATPTQARASEEYACSGGTYSIDSEGVVSNLESCAGELILNASAKSFDNTISGSELTSITLPASFNVSDNYGEFWIFPNLLEWKVAPSNPNLIAYEQGLYSKDLTILYAYPATKTGTFTAASTLKGIGAGAFRYSKLTRIDLSSNVESIGRDAFSSSMVEELNFSAELNIVNPITAFSGDLKTITLDPSNPNLKILNSSLLSKDGKTFWLAPANAATPVCNIPEGVESIETYSLSGNPCEEITLPTSLVTIKDYALYLTQLKRLHVPARVTTIVGDPLPGSQFVEEISVDSKNNSFKAVDGVLYDSGITTLIYYPQSRKATKFILPKTVSAELPTIGESRYALDLEVEEGNSTYISIDGVIYDLKSEILYGYPGGRTDASYILPATTRKIVEGAIVNNYLRMIISTEDPNLIDTTTSGLVILDAKTGLARLKSLLKDTISELNERLVSTREELSAEVKTKDDEAKSFQSTLIKVQEALDAVHYNGLYRTQLCDGGVMTITFDGKLSRAWDCKGEVNIPSFVESLDEYALYTSESMTKLNIPASVEKIDSILFDGTTSLSEINVDPENEKFSSVDGVLFNKDKTLLVLYPSAKTTDKYIVPSSVRAINHSAFLGAKVKEIVLPPELDSIGFGTFTKSEIEKITILKNYKGWIPPNTFARTSKLTSITVESGNEKYVSKSGVLYSKDGTSLILYPIAKSGTTYVVPEGVETIEAYAFQNAPITSISLPSTLQTIGYEAFGESKLESLSFPASTNISNSSPFTGLKSLKSITIDPANTFATMKDGVLYSKDMKKLIYLPPNLDSKSFVIPSGVTEIDFSAFAGSNVTEITFTSDIKDLDYFNFSDSKIETINISADFVSFPEFLFDYVPNLKSINVNSNNAKYSSLNGILFNKDKTKLIKIPAKNPTTDYVVPASVVQMSSTATYGNEFLTKIVFGPKTTSILGGALAYASALQTIEVDSANPTYTSRDGILYNKAFTRLEAFPMKFQGKTLSLPSTLVTLDSSAFFSGPNLETLRLPSSLDSLESWRFNLNVLKLLIYDGKDPRVSNNLFLLRKEPPRILTSAELASEEAKAVQDEKVKSDLKKAQDDAKIASDAKALADSEAKAAKDAQVKAEAEAKAALEAKAIAEANAKSASDAKALAEANSKSASDAKALAESEAKSAKAAQAKAEADAKSASDARAAAEAALSALIAKVTSTITCVKGKTTKKVTGILPTCPKGYKKK